MREGSGIVLIVIALFIGYLAVSGKYACVTRMFRCIASDDPSKCDCAGTSTGDAPKSYLDEMIELYRNALPFPLTSFQ